MATKNSLSITKFKEIAAILPKEDSVLIRADHGVGKSEVVRQIATTIRERDFNGKGFPFIDRRLGQMTEGDMVGLPSTDGNVTRFNPPDWIRRACDEPCFIFLDEINRGTLEVMQAAFELVLDRRCQGNSLHPDTRVMAAVNVGGTYRVTQMDPALLDRFVIVDLVPTAPEWIDHNRTIPGFPDSVVDFIASHDKWLFTPHGSEADAVTPSPRSWTRAGLAIAKAGVAEDGDHELHYTLTMLRCGVDAAAAYHDYVKNNWAKVKPSDVLTLAKAPGSAIIFKNAEGRDTVNCSLIGQSIDNTQYRKSTISKLEKWSAERLTNFTQDVADAVVACINDEKFTVATGISISKFMSMLPKETQTQFFAQINKGSGNRTQHTIKIHPYLSPHLMAANGYAVPQQTFMAGVGAAPAVPDPFAKPADDGTATAKKSRKK